MELATLELLTLALIPSFLVADLVYRARRNTPTRWWRLRAFLVTAVSFVWSVNVATFWGTLIGDHTVFNLSALGTVVGAVVGILVYQLVHYWYHRMLHSSDFLFRNIHQMHHSAETLDAWGAYYLHPVDVFFFTTWGSLVFFPLLGVTPMAGAIGAAFLTFNAMFQHANLRTPRWLGYLVQRPESHGVHHQRGVHRHNYADLPLMDILFGTFENPARFEGVCGYYDGASARIPEMLVGKDVSRSREEKASVEVVSPIA